MTAERGDFDIDDPIEECFSLMVDGARRLCRGRDHADDACFRYHLLWPYQRLIGRNHGASRGARHFLATFGELAREGRSARILISGCADYIMLAYTLLAYRQEGVEPQVTVLDFCEAPLFINRWYAERHTAKITTVACDTTGFSSESEFDVITTHHFLSQFAPSAHPCKKRG